MDFSDMNHILKELIMCYKKIRPVLRADDDSLDVSVPEVKCVQSSVSAQPPRIAVSKFRSPESVASLMRNLKVSRSCCGAGTSKD